MRYSRAVTDPVETGPLVNTGERRVRLTEHEAQVNVNTVLQLCASGKLRCSEKTKRPTAATVRAVVTNLANGDFYLLEPIASFAWALLIQAGGLATLDNGRLELTAKGRAALRQPAPDTIRQLWRRWITGAVIDEFSRIEEIKGQRASNVLSSAKTRRAAVADALAACPPGEWISVDALFSTMRRSNLSPTIARNYMALWKLYIGDAHYGSLGYDGFHKWELLEGRYTLAVLFEYAATLGLADLDYVHPIGARDDHHDNWGADDLDCLSRYDGLRAIRLNPLGAYAVGLTGDYMPPDSGHQPGTLKVLPNLDVVATGTVSAADKILLSSYAEQTNERVWSVSTASLLTAIDAGRDLDELAAFLKQRADHELPGALETLISDITARAGQLSDFGHARVIECRDPAVAALIAHDKTLRRLCRPIGDRHLAIPLNSELSFRKALRKVGYVLPNGSL